MPRFLATTSLWQTDLLEAELKDLGLTQFEQIPGGVFFDSNWEGCYRANLCSRLASRILLTILDFPTYDGDDLYHNVQKHDFTKYIEPNGTLAVEASVRDSAHNDQRFVAMRVKDAVVDQFRDKFGVRPDVDNRDTDLRIMCHIHRNHASLSIDTSGDSLFKRGYRVGTVTAPLKETLAAALIQRVGWKGDQPIVDLMCGSGTILIEAALMALNIAPGTLRRQFGFQRLLGFQKEVWEKVVRETMDKEKEELPFKLFGFDRDREAVASSKRNAQAAGVGDYVEIRKMSVDLVDPPTDHGIIIMNPPYGERLDQEVNDSYLDLAYTLKHKFQGWTAYVLSGNPDIGNVMGLKADQKIPVMNGPIECRLLRYQIRKTT